MIWVQKCYLVLLKVCLSEIKMSTSEKGLLWKLCTKCWQLVMRMISKMSQSNDFNQWDSLRLNLFEKVKYKSVTYFLPYLQNSSQ